MPPRLRRNHKCQIRRSSSVDSPLCGRPAFNQRPDVRLWACNEHMYWSKK